MSKRILGVVLTFVMAMSLMQVGVFAKPQSNFSVPTGVASDTPHFAEGLYNSGNTPQGEFQLNSTGLISQYDLSFGDNGNRTITVYGNTFAFETMAKVGFTSISVKRWNGSSWVTEKNFSDQLNSNASTCSLSSSTSVAGGYYYKVTLNHYAKESGLFGSSQSVFNETSYIWIS